MVRVHARWLAVSLALSPMGCDIESLQSQAEKELGQDEGEAYWASKGLGKTYRQIRMRASDHASTGGRTEQELRNAVAEEKRELVEAAGIDDSDATGDADLLNSKAPPEIHEVRIFHQKCDTPCPSYHVTLTGTGTVEYRGIEMVKELGTRESKVEDRAAQDALIQLVRGRIWNAKTATGCETPQENVDQGLVEITLRADSRQKKITFAAGDPCAPRRLWPLLAKVEQTAQVEQWIKCEAGDCAK